MPDLLLEQALAAKARGSVAGIDEVGRGPWAGPVVACAAILPDLSAPFSGLPEQLFRRIKDSKALKPATREDVADQLVVLLDHGVGVASVEEIDAMNILQASFLAMRRAMAALPQKPAACLVDGNRDPGLSCATELVVKGDSRSVAVAAASIIAKTHRDRLMIALAALHPGYGWERNMGYGTKQHQAGLAELGVSDHHRRSFSPIRAWLTSDTRP